MVRHPLALLMAGALLAWSANWLRTTSDAALMAQRHWVFATWLALAVQSMLEFPYAHAYFLLPGALLAGAITAPAATSHAAPVASRWVRALGAGTALLFCMLVWEYFQLESDFRFNRFERANFSTKTSHQALQSPWVLDQLAALNASAQQPPATGLSDAQLEARRVLARRFHIPSVRFEYAQALALNGRRAEAEHELLVIRSMNPPQTFARIDKTWRAWLAANASTIQAAAANRR